MPVTYTPLRYPGGKTKLYEQVKTLVEASVGKEGVYVEPFAGGAGLAIKLLLLGDVKEIVINDFDRAVYCAWKSILYDESLPSFIEDVPLTVEEWETHRQKVDNLEQFDDFELGRAALFLNRTNISGIIKGGPIGGRLQKGKYKLDARFPKKGLLKKIEAIRERRDSISLYSMDACDFINKQLTKVDHTKTFVYFDPPYVDKGPQLYKNSFRSENHEELAAAIRKLRMYWLVTYDDCEFVNNLFEGEEIKKIEIAYSAGKTKTGKEIAVFSQQLAKCIGAYRD